jgi:hypothetical protein
MRLQDNGPEGEAPPLAQVQARARVQAQVQIEVVVADESLWVAVEEELEEQAKEHNPNEY